MPVVRCQDCERPVLQSAILNHAGSSSPLALLSSRFCEKETIKLKPALSLRVAAKCLKVRQLEQAGAQGEDDDGRSLSVSLKPSKRRLSNGQWLAVSHLGRLSRPSADPS